MNTSARRLGAVGLAVTLGLALNSCGGEDAGEESDGAAGEPSPVESSAAAGASDDSGPSGDAGEDSSPESSPTPVPASSEGPAQNWPEPEVPDEIYEETQEGALAALEYWFEARTFLQLTGSAGPLVGASSADCAFCSVVIEQYEYAYEDMSAWYVSDQSTVEEARVSDVREGFDTGVFFNLHEAEFRVYDESGEVLSSGGGDVVQNVEAHVEFVGDRWIVMDIYAPSGGK